MKNKKLIRPILVLTLIGLIATFSLAQPDSEKLGNQKAFFNENLYVIGEECVGVDCINGEALALTTLKLKENNLRIDFDDTSNSQEFPENDWRIQVNDSFNGGEDYFKIDDVTGGTSPFYIEAGANTNSFYIDEAGNIGLGTSNPSKRLHVVGNGLITGEFEVLSDMKVKKNISNIANATATLSALRAVSYDMRTKEFPNLKLSDDKQYGLIAQEVLKILPALVSDDHNNDNIKNEESLMSVNYLQLIPILIRANQEQSEEITELKKVIQVLTDRIDKIDKK